MARKSAPNSVFNFKVDDEFHWLISMNQLNLGCHLFLRSFGQVHFGSCIVECCFSKRNLGPRFSLWLNQCHQRCLFSSLGSLASGLGFVYELLWKGCYRLLSALNLQLLMMAPQDLQLLPATLQSLLPALLLLKTPKLSFGLNQWTNHQYTHQNRETNQSYPDPVWPHSLNILTQANSAKSFQIQTHCPKKPQRSKRKSPRLHRMRFCAALIAPARLHQLVGRLLGHLLKSKTQSCASV